MESPYSEAEEGWWLGWGEQRLFPGDRTSVLQGQKSGEKDGCISPGFRALTVMRTASAGWASPALQQPVTTEACGVPTAASPPFHQALRPSTFSRRNPKHTRCCAFLSSLYPHHHCPGSGSHRFPSGQLQGPLAQAPAFGLASPHPAHTLPLRGSLQNTKRKGSRHADQTQPGSRSRPL